MVKYLILILLFLRVYYLDTILSKLFYTTTIQHCVNNNNLCFYVFYKYLLLVNCKLFNAILVIC